jgi:threonine dehydrogenase-like Zn-dependent dehydrogenase
MKAIAVFPRTKEVKVIEHEAPLMTEPDQVKVCMLEIGMCGKDKEICAYEYGMPPEGSDYLVIGWETFGLQGARPHIAIV